MTERTDDNTIFREMMTPIAKELAGRDPRMEKIVADFVTHGYFDAREVVGSNVLGEYWLDITDTEHVLTLAGSEHEDLYWYDKIAKAAADPEIRALVGWLMDMNIDNQMLLQDCNDRLETIVAKTYGLPRDLCDQVLNLCENTLREEEMQYGEA